MARSRGDDQLEELPAQDSFLDLIANIVGIMILLVVIVGIRAATSVPAEIVTTAPGPPPVSVAEVEEAARRLRQIRQEEHEFRLRAVRLDHQADELDRDRIALLGYVDEVERELKERRDQLDSRKQQEFDVLHAIASAEEQYDELARELLALDSGLEQSKTLRNVPTPLARAVKNDEITFWVNRGKVAVVPTDELTDLALADLKRRSHVPGGISTVGPVNGFSLYYAPISRTAPAPMGGAVRVTGVVGEIRPRSESQGWSVESSCEPGSLYRDYLTKFKPSTTTITFWTPGSGFSDVGRLREIAAQQGFSTAVRPLADGRYIQFAPWGRKTRAQ